MNKEIDVSDVVLKTERLILRPWTYDDLHDFYEYASVDGVGQPAGWLPHKNMEESRSVLDMFIKGKNVLAIEYLGKVIGSISVDEYDEDEFPEFKDKYVRELGYQLSKDYWGKGLMPETVNAVTKYLFETVNLDVIICSHFNENEQSKRVQEKCGFKFYKPIKLETRYGAVKDSRASVKRNRDREL